MLGIDRRALKIVWTVFVVVLIGAIVYQVRHTLMIFMLALFFSHLLAPIVAYFERTAHARVPRVAILVLVYVGMLAIIIGTLIPVGSRIGEQAASLAARFPALLKEQDPLGKLPLPAAFESARPKLTEFVRGRIDDLEQHVLPFLSSASAEIVSGIGNVLSAILIPILSFFFLKDGASIRKTVVESFSHAHQPVVNEIIMDLNLLLAQYIRALVVLSLCAGGFYAAFLSIASVQYAILLACVAAVLEFIPVVGPLTASLAIVLVAAFTGYPHVLWILVFLVIYRIFQDYVLSPYLMSAGVEVHPLLVLFGVLAGEQIAGVPGMFFSVPTIAALRVFYVRLRRQRRASA
jgi:predicted PurR-regulated permease PerM